MPLTHKAYTFNPPQFHREIEEQSISNNDFSLNNLLPYCRQIVANASDVTQKTLHYLRYDSEWLDPVDEGLFATDLYIIVLAKHLTPAPSLSNRLHSYGILELVLPYANWTQEQIKLLIRGKPLHTLLEFSNNPILLRAFTDVDQYGGWIDLQEVEKLFARLTRAADHFFSPQDREFIAIDELSKFPAYKQRDLQNILRDAYTDAKEMLETSLQRGEPIFIIFD